ncbi:hypothetical protein [Diaphorobacter sp. HDW4A]|nr:hypothetical protein [Diaphorobacter sp. HDW4A]
MKFQQKAAHVAAFLHSGTERGQSKTANENDDVHVIHAPFVF